MEHSKSCLLCSGPSTSPKGHVLKAWLPAWGATGRCEPFSSAHPLPWLDVHEQRLNFLRSMSLLWGWEKTGVGGTLWGLEVRLHQQTGPCTGHGQWLVDIPWVLWENARGPGKIMENSFSWRNKLLHYVCKLICWNDLSNKRRISDMFLAQREEVQISVLMNHLCQDQWYWICG
jgi:hypothetical protein